MKHNSTALSPVELSLFSNRLEAVCDEMGAVLQRSAFSPNIKDRLDFSCAVFDTKGDLNAQAAHIPVHMGSMAYAMRHIVTQTSWQEGDMLLLNDPYLGGTHLPDVTLVAPLFVNNKLVAFVANRAHHADIGAETPGSMPVSSTLAQEGLLLAPTLLLQQGVLDGVFLEELAGKTANRNQTLGDFSAQVSANRTGLERLMQLIRAMGVDRYQQGLNQLNDYAATLAATALKNIPDGNYDFEDSMDNDGISADEVLIKATVEVVGDRIVVDFSGTGAQTAGNINCPLSVAAAGVYYVFRCLMPAYTPTCQGIFRNIEVKAPKGCLLNAERPAAVAAGNVETSTRVVDVVMGALAQAIPALIPAASHGSMNNVAAGARAHQFHKAWDYYETIGGGMGAGASGGGLSAVQTHMTNTRNTPVEVLEMNYPMRILRYEIRHGSGGQGRFAGGDGIVREFQFLADTTVTLLTERRKRAPWGLNGGGAAAVGENWLNEKKLPGKVSLTVKGGDRLCIKTPGGGAWGRWSN
ncbi:MAG: hydantoinase B/oxoprolinase family protein [Gammaproteobacteria bacterium]|nr:hydantoinase B/oxoprolinase family protein [Gammaproteobacteria bacterium]MDH5799839.1 hydantoinase B/oxoprolinase family protein [Gammaproteobacteria bacterium]